MMAFSQFPTDFTIHKEFRDDFSLTTTKKFKQQNATINDHNPATQVENNNNAVKERENRNNRKESESFSVQQTISMFERIWLGVCAFSYSFYIRSVM